MTKALLHWSAGIWVTLKSTYVYPCQKRAIVFHKWPGFSMSPVHEPFMLGDLNKPTHS